MLGTADPESRLIHGSFVLDRLLAQPLNADDQNEFVRRVDQECDQSFVVSSEMRRTQRRRRLVGPVLVLERIDDHHGNHEGSQRGAGGWAQGSRCLLGGSVQFPWYSGQTPYRARTSCRVMRWLAGGGLWVR
jgi:hypothetical protein